MAKQDPSSLEASKTSQTAPTAQAPPPHRIHVKEDVETLPCKGPREAVSRIRSRRPDEAIARSKRGENVHLAELEELHGYDTKYAMHVIRLYGEAKELMENGRITLPRPNRDELIEIRKGKYSLTEIQELGWQLEIEALAAQTSSPLPDRVGREAISNLLTDVQLQLWNEPSLGLTELPEED